MILPGFRRLNKQDFQAQYQQFVDQLSNSLNIGIESLYSALNGNVSLKNNVSGTLKDVAVTVDATGTPTSATTFSLNDNRPIIGTQVIYALNTSNSNIYPTGGIFITFTQTTTGILISNITGLPPNQPFTIRIMAYGN